MKITTNTVEGFKVCAVERTEADRCRGYDVDQPATIVVETVERLFGDEHQDWHDPYAQVMSTTLDTLKPAREEDARCDVCGGVVSLSLTPRPRYRRASPQHPDMLLTLLAEKEEREAREARQMTAQEETAAILKELVANIGQRDELAELRALVVEQQATLAELTAGNGDDPKPARKPRAKDAEHE